jgi:acetyl coenzyme A synthetase (ADP forming)-like protein
VAADNRSKAAGRRVRFPSYLDADAVLRDGSTVHIRPVVPEDREALAAFLAGLSDESRIFRFFSPVRDLGWAARSFTDVDYLNRHGLLALRGDPEGIVGHGLYMRTDPDRAEVAFAIADELQGHGLGTILLGLLADEAYRAGISLFYAEVLPENQRMLGVFRDSGFPVHSRAVNGVVEIELPTSLTPAALDEFEERSKQAAVAALQRFFEPEAIAVVGATSKRGSIGGEVFANLLRSGFPGPVYPVSPHPVVQSVLAYPDVGKIPGPVDLAIIVVPAAEVVEVARQCAEKGVRALVVISAGFAEAGSAGRARQDELVAVCRAAGIRLIGPNCMGILTTSPQRPMNATFAPNAPPEGGVGFMSQSGAIGLAVIDHAAEIGLGISAFVSVGNKADISGNDLLDFWEEDPSTNLVMLYLESFGNPRRFSRIARRVARRKPILAVKSGRSPAGTRASSSHTGALLAASDVTVDALFRQAGVIRAESLGELFDVASLLVNAPLPAGRRVGIVTNAGGLGILCADACEAGGLEVPVLGQSTTAQLAEFLPSEASLTNPMDILASATSEQYARAIAVLGESPEVDSVIVIFIPPLAERADEVVAAIGRAAAGIRQKKPVLLVVMHRESRLQAGQKLPSFTFPEDAARALALVQDWVDWRRRPGEEAVEPAGLRQPDARRIIARALTSGGGWLSFGDAADLLAAYGVELAPWAEAKTVAETAAAAGRLGPSSLVLKAIGPELNHKSDLGAVVLGLKGPGAVRREAAAMAERLASGGKPVESFLVQKMVEEGVEMIVGVVQDPVFGPVLACGAGGAAVELVKDIQVRLTPLTPSEALGMVEALKTYPLLRGYRGRPQADVEALIDLLVRVSAMVEAHQEIAEMDLNPVICGPSGAPVVDVRIRIADIAPRPAEGARRRLRTG